MDLGHKVMDYNGEGMWSAAGIGRRYAEYCKLLRIFPVTDLSPQESSEGARRWVYPVMEKVIAGIEKGDAACKRIGIDFVEEDGKFPFGKILKSNTARALRRASLTDEEKERIRTRVVGMLVRGQVPHEFKEYAKLLKKIGLGNAREVIEAHADRENRYVMRHVRNLLGADQMSGG